MTKTEPETKNKSEAAFSLADDYLAANPGLAEALEVFAISKAAYDRAVRGLPQAVYVSADSTGLAAAPSGHLG